MKVDEIRVDREFETRLPAPAAEEFEALRSDIERQGGIIVPLLVTDDGLLLDGHRRLRAARELGIDEVPVRTLWLRGESWGKAIALASNLHRRHLNEASRALLGDSLLRLEQEKARERQAAAGRSGRPGSAAPGERVGNGSPLFPGGDGGSRETYGNGSHKFRGSEDTGGKNPYGNRSHKGFDSRPGIGSASASSPGDGGPRETHGNGSHEFQGAEYSGEKNPHTNGSPKGLEDGLATTRVARQLGISRKTFERVQAVKKADPALVRKAADGEVSVAEAYGRVKVREVQESARTEAAAPPAGRVVTDLEGAMFRYKTIVVDPPWLHGDAARARKAGISFLTVDDLARLPIPALASVPGAHVWIWTTFAKLRDGEPQELVRRWDLRWVGEICWNRVNPPGSGAWLRAQVEVLLLAVTRKCCGLLKTTQPNYHEEAVDRYSSRRPQGVYDIIRSLCRGPRIEVFAREPRDGWDRFEYTPGVTGEVTAGEAGTSVVTGGATPAPGSAARNEAPGSADAAGDSNTPEASAPPAAGRNGKTMRDEHVRRHGKEPS